MDSFYEGGRKDSITGHDDSLRSPIRGGSRDANASSLSKKKRKKNRNAHSTSHVWAA